MNELMARDHRNINDQSVLPDRQLLSESQAGDREYLKDPQGGPASLLPTPFKKNFGRARLPKLYFHSTRGYTAGGGGSLGDLKSRLTSRPATHTTPHQSTPLSPCLLLCHGVVGGTHGQTHHQPPNDLFALPVSALLVIIINPW